METIKSIKIFLKDRVDANSTEVVSATLLQVAFCEWLVAKSLAVPLSKYI